MAVAFALALSGCGKGEDSAASSEAAPEEEAAAAKPASGQTTAAIAAARTSLNAGKVDEAAAKLAQLQAQGATFSAGQAKDYRQALSDAYDRAIEAAQRGDPRAQAALQLLRAAAPR